MDLTQMTLDDLRADARSNATWPHGQVLHGSNEPVDSMGRPVLGMWETPVRVGDWIHVEKVSSQDDFHQGFVLNLSGGVLANDRALSHALQFWTDRSFRSSISVRVIESGPTGTLQLWNKWRKRSAPVDEAWTWSGNAGIVEPEGDPRDDEGVLLRCSNGWGAVDFDDLILRMQVDDQPRPTRRRLLRRGPDRL